MGNFNHNDKKNQTAAYMVALTKAAERMQEDVSLWNNRAICFNDLYLLGMDLGMEDEAIDEALSERTMAVYNAGRVA